MKSKNMIKTAELIQAAVDAKKPKVGFNLVSYKATDGNNEDKTGHGCGTTACIGGFAYLASGRTIAEFKKASTVNIAQEAAKFLGLTKAEKDELFTPDIILRCDDRWLDVTPKNAIATLYASAAAKKIIWIKETY